MNCPHCRQWVILNHIEHPERILSAIVEHFLDDGTRCPFSGVVLEGRQW